MLVDIEGEGGGVTGAEGRVDEVVAGGIAVPEEVCGFGGADAQEGFGLQVEAVLAVEGVGDGDGGGVVDGEEFGAGGEDAGDEGGGGGGGGEVSGGDGYGGCGGGGVRAG